MARSSAGLQVPSQVEMPREERSEDAEYLWGRERSLSPCEGLGKCVVLLNNRAKKEKRRGPGSTADKWARSIIKDTAVSQNSCFRSDQRSSNLVLVFLGRVVVCRFNLAQQDEWVSGTIDLGDWKWNFQKVLKNSSDARDMEFNSIPLADAYTLLLLNSYWKHWKRGAARGISECELNIYFLRLAGWLAGRIDGWNTVSTSHQLPSVAKLWQASLFSLSHRPYPTQAILSSLPAITFDFESI